MTNYVVKVTLVPSADGERVKAYPLLIPGDSKFLNPGDTVTWVFDESAGARDLRVVFTQVTKLYVGGAPPEDIDPYGPFPNGPFATLQIGRTIVGTVVNIDQDPTKNQRFTYQIYDRDKPIPWSENFGGVDKPKPPPYS